MSWRVTVDRDRCARDALGTGRWPEVLRVDDQEQIELLVD